MIATLMPLHPSDETLSRIADQDEMERMRSRAGRHVARCARCRETIDTIAALGAAARALPAAEPSPELEARILESFAASTTPSRGALHITGDVEPDARATRRMRRPALIAAAASIALIALAWPVLRERDLAAANADRLSILPRYPRAGTTARVRFLPPPNMPPADTLWLEGTFRVADGANGEGRDDVDATVPLVRVGGEFRGALPIPQRALAGSLGLVHPDWPRLNRHRIDGTLVLVAGVSGDRPSLDALEAAADAASFWPQRERLAAEFVHWAPRHPLRWVLEPRRSSGGTFDWLGYFTSKERRFASLTRELADRRGLRAGELAGMAELAYEIEEPEAAAQWTDRLVRDFPRSSWSLGMRAAELHAMELRGAGRDSIAALMPALDSLLYVAPLAPGDRWTLSGVIERNGDAAMRYRWKLHMARNGLTRMDLTGRQEDLRDPALADSAERGARERLAGSAAMHGPEVARTRALAYGMLASVALSRGDYQRAIALTDSSRLDSCRWVGRDTRGLAYLALGDSSNARRFLLPFAAGEWSGAARAQRVLGLDVNDPRVKQLADSARAAIRCGR